MPAGKLPPSSQKGTRPEPLKDDKLNRSSAEALSTPDTKSKEKQVTLASNHEEVQLLKLQTSKLEERVDSVETSLSLKMDVLQETLMTAFSTFKEEQLSHTVKTPSVTSKSDSKVSYDPTEDISTKDGTDTNENKEKVDNYLVFESKKDTSDKIRKDDHQADETDGGKV